MIQLALFEGEGMVEKRRREGQTSLSVRTDLADRIRALADSSGVTVFGLTNALIEAGLKHEISVEVVQVVVKPAEQLKPAGKRK